MCLGAVNTYGNRPIKLLIIININKVSVIIVDPLEEDGPNKVLNSRCNFSVTKFIVVFNLFLKTQYEGLIINKNSTALIQFKGILNDVEGSKIENKLVIIFIIIVCNKNLVNYFCGCINLLY